MHDRLGQVELRLRQTHELDGTRRGVGHDQRHRIGHADVFRCEDHEPAGDEPGVFSCFEHASHPIQRGIGVRPADALDERADHVVVLVAPVAQCLGADRGLGVSERVTRGAARVAGSSQRGRDLDRRERLATIAGRERHEVRASVVVDRCAFGFQAAPMSASVASTSRGSSRNSVDRDSSGALTSK